MPGSQSDKSTHDCADQSQRCGTHYRERARWRIQQKSLVHSVALGPLALLLVLEGALQRVQATPCGVAL